MIKLDDSNVIIFTDGGSHNNGIRKGDGSWAFVVYDPNNKSTFGRCQFLTDTTNNRTEMLAVLHAIDFAHKYFAGRTAVIYSDSGYLVKGYLDPAYLDRWKVCGWITSSGDPVKNQDLWQALLNQAYCGKKFILKHMRGHMKDNDREAAFWNNIVDKVCTWVMNEHTDLVEPTDIIIQTDKIEISVDYAHRITTLLEGANNG